MAHATGQSRYQTSLFPEVLDDMIPHDHQVRVIDAFVDALDLAQLGFSKVEAEQTGRPPYAPGDLLKLYIYGYLNQIRSSRRLARETCRNVEVMWLINRVTPAFKTIADFRKDHPWQIVAVCRAFIGFCREQSLFGGELLAIDGTKIAAVASRKQVITPAKLAKATEALDSKIAEYLVALDAVDREEAAASDLASADLSAALEALKAQRTRLQIEAANLARRGLKQLVVTEEEAKLMRTPQGHAVAYNAQIAVDDKHHLVAAFDLTNEGNDQQQLHPMAVQGKEAVGAEEITAVADTGYSNGEHGALCEHDGITAIVPRAETVNSSGKQYFSRNEFSYDAASDTYQCPAGQTLTCNMVSPAQQQKRYSTPACGTCALKPQCTGSPTGRLIYRSFFEESREAMHQRAHGDPRWMRQRAELAEHPLGTIKWLMGHARFLVRGITKAKAEFALGVLSYNLRRVINICGVPALLRALQACPA